VNAYEVKAGIGAILQVKLCDPCLSALSVKYYKRALYKHTYLYLPILCIRVITSFVYCFLILNILCHALAQIGMSQHRQ